jgi:hypothetical protein
MQKNCLPPHNHMGTPRMVTGTVFLVIHVVTVLSRELGYKLTGFDEGRKV